MLHYNHACLCNYDATCSSKLKKKKRLNTPSNFKARGTKSDHEVRHFFLADSSVAGDLCPSGQLWSFGETHNNQQWRRKYSKYQYWIWPHENDSTLTSDKGLEDVNRCNFWEEFYKWSSLCNLIIKRQYISIVKMLSWCYFQCELFINHQVVSLSNLLNPFDIFGEVGCKIKIILLRYFTVCSRCWGSGCTLGGAPTFQGAAPSPIWWPASGWTSLQQARATSSISCRLRECKFTLCHPGDKAHMHADAEVELFFTGWLIWDWYQNLVKNTIQFVFSTSCFLTQVNVFPNSVSKKWLKMNGCRCFFLLPPTPQTDLGNVPV